MPGIITLKEDSTLRTPLLLFECTLADGSVRRFSSHRPRFGVTDWDARVVSHSGFALSAAGEGGLGAGSQLTLTLANTDGVCSQIERTVGWKGTRLRVLFALYDFRDGSVPSAPETVFLGMSGAPLEMREDVFRISFSDRLKMQRVSMPQLRIQGRCPWQFPRDAAERAEALDGGAAGAYARLYPCGYSQGAVGGRGNADAGGAPFTACAYTKSDCVARGMYKQDAAGQTTARFGGFGFLPASTLVRTHGDKQWHVGSVVDGRAQANDTVPLLYGTAWYQPPVVFAQNDGNLTRCEVLLGAGPMTGVRRVVVEGYEAPESGSASATTATGWYQVVSLGGRDGAFNADFKNESGEPAGDPHGGMAVLSVVVPNAMAAGTRLPKIEVLADGLALPRYDAAGAALAPAFTANPAWILLDLLRRAGWRLEEIDLQSFAASAAYCDETVAAVDESGNTTNVARAEAHLLLDRPRSLADVVRGLRNTSTVALTYGAAGKLRAVAESTLARQQSVKPAGSNAAVSLLGGWPAYEFGDGTNGFGSIAMEADGTSSLVFSSRGEAESANRLTVEFQDAFREYQQSSLSLAEFDELRRTGNEVSAAFAALGLPHLNQAARMLKLELARQTRGNRYATFRTSIRGMHLRPADLITLSHAGEGYDRQPFRVVSVRPDVNYETVEVVAQLHADEWYAGVVNGLSLGSDGRPRGGAEQRRPRPVAGAVRNAQGEEELALSEVSVAGASDAPVAVLRAGFTPPAQAVDASLAAPVLPANAIYEAGLGSLAGGQTYYYAVSGVTAAGAESALSAPVAVRVPATVAACRVRLRGMQFDAQTTLLRLYRGGSPQTLRRIADGVAAAEYADEGAAASLTPPPDVNYHHTNLYWRWEILPPVAATAFGAKTIGAATLALAVNEHVGMLAAIVAGRGNGQERRITANTATVLTLERAWNVLPDATSRFTIVEPTWRQAGATASDAAEFELPQRTGWTAEVQARAANARDEETAAELSPVGRWQVGSGGVADSAAPGAPSFALASNLDGSLELGGIGFASLQNTATIASGTLTAYAWNEKESPTGVRLALAVAAGDTALSFTAAAGIVVNDLLQIDKEVLAVAAVAADRLSCTVTRGSHGSVAAAHAAAAAVYPLRRHVVVLPFPKRFFGSPASGSYTSRIAMPEVRVAAAELFVTNAFGDSPVTRGSLTDVIDKGLRTMAGGQFAVQVGGELAVGAELAPPLVVEATHAVRDVFATVQRAPLGAALALRVLADGTPYAELTVAAGETKSNTVDGFGLAPLAAGAKLTLEILSVGTGAGSYPGKDLTVTIRL